jgi:hypothetical protein
VVESVYSAVRTDALYKADYVSYVKGQYCHNPFHDQVFYVVCPVGREGVVLIATRYWLDGYGFESPWSEI